jgi:hypothetical protein
VAADVVRRGGLEVLVLDELAGAGVDAIVTTRVGGVSEAPYDTLNLGDHVGDDPAAVSENRGRLAAAMGLAAADLVIARQVHGIGVATVRRGDVAGDADVLATDDPAVALCILVADCVPIAVVDARAHVLVVAHAGWRGTASSVAAAAVDAAVALGASAARCHAVLGPCISPRAYQVGAEVADALTRAGCADAVTPDGTGRFLADLRAANALQLERAGVDPSHIIKVAHHTDGGATFFSDRAARPCGRFALAARLTHGRS